MTKEIISWGIYKNAFEDARKEDIRLILLLQSIDTEEITEEIIILDKEDAVMLDAMVNKQLLPLLKGKKIFRGEYAIKPKDVTGYG